MVVGSTNFDYRSFAINDEVNLALLDAESTRRVGENFERDLTHSKEITYAEWQKKFRFRMTERIFSVLDTAGMRRFRVATYNVHKCKGMDWRISCEAGGGGCGRVGRRSDCSAGAFAGAGGRHLAACRDAGYLWAAARKHGG